MRRGEKKTGSRKRMVNGAYKRYVLWYMKRKPVCYLREITRFLSLLFPDKNRESLRKGVWRAVKELEREGVIRVWSRGKRKSPILELIEKPNGNDCPETEEKLEKLLNQPISYTSVYRSGVVGGGLVRGVFVGGGWFFTVVFREGWLGGFLGVGVVEVLEFSEHLHLHGVGVFRGCRGEVCVKDRIRRRIRDRLVGRGVPGCIVDRILSGVYIHVEKMVRGTEHYVLSYLSKTVSKWSRYDKKWFSLNMVYCIGVRRVYWIRSDKIMEAWIDYQNWLRRLFVYNVVGDFLRLPVLV